MALVRIYLQSPDGSWLVSSPSGDRLYIESEEVADAVECLETMIFERPDSLEIAIDEANDALSISISEVADTLQISIAEVC